MFIESVIALMLLSLAVFAVPVRWKWQVAFCVVGLGVLSALYEDVGVFSGGGRIYPEGINIVFGPQYGVTDPLSSFFLIILSLSAVAVLIYAKGYIKPYLGRKSPAQISLHYCGLGILYLSMLLVVTLRDGFSFLFAWEVMTLSSFVLMLFDAARREVRRAALSYLILMHVGFLFLLAGFVTLYASGLPASFDALALYGEQGGNIIPLFIVFLIGFGMKAGIFPLHVWLPEAHPAAPAHISAFMSGVMIKTGVYGVMRVVSCFDSHLFAIGLIVLCIGAVTGLWGVILAALQNDVKKLLAYSSIENIGIIFIALGTALLGKAEGSDPIFYAGMAGALLHTLNHSFFKSLLFMGAGNIYTATHTTSLDDLGGLGKRMPVTAILFLVGTLAICALPPLSGFVSEFLIYMGLLDGIAANGPVTVIALSGLIFLALIGGLAVLAFTKLYGVVFSGLPRSEVAERAREVSRPMLVAAGGYPVGGVGARVRVAVDRRARGPDCRCFGSLSDLCSGGRIGPHGVFFRQLPAAYLRDRDAGGNFRHIVAVALVGRAPSCRKLFAHMELRLYGGDLPDAVYRRIVQRGTGPYLGTDDYQPARSRTDRRRRDFSHGAPFRRTA